MNLRKLAELVKARRVAMQLTRQQVAELAGVHWRSVGNLERCDVDTRWGVAVAIAEAVGVTLYCVEHFQVLADTERGPCQRPKE